MKFGVVIFPGSNCDHDTTYLLDNTLGQEVVELWHKDHDLQNCDFIILPGGFSFGDYLRSGAIARFSPIMREVIAFAEKGGYVLGICNGFQILCEAGLLPGALLHNPTRKFICTNSCLKVQTADTIITSQVNPDRPLRIPVAHGEGSYYARPEILQQLNSNDQVLFRYCDTQGNFTPESNPNGSVENIAGICNQGRNVFGMMPHPERAADPALGNQDGLAVFQSILHGHDLVQS
ncbi:phosphoribosylformylglycinamidine synthase [Anseongella ginsenosidimutans]|uniref:Phosphoribosylformylglycinamidine synthase subunit PurQ n=1 Tax=Anseongella ginsenosidimutans TaxID=496056 RepID=A0A4R3KLD4_9SPHI|nr:phosphoribosylformylglycinamidine synthase subunit PurQ [Anseongella ginsenosidimutans]QEC52095.1 phosphoribosylformylglycinamidine synthase subunit PurQ [Anseongella ginsenosidimutans]TCS84876.1 phosphoribosylformylglycinamidine synthase [Anseongella ginsenosidimutans]